MADDDIAKMQPRQIGGMQQSVFSSYGTQGSAGYTQGSAGYGTQSSAGIGLGLGQAQAQAQVIRTFLGHDTSDWFRLEGIMSRLGINSPAELANLLADFNAADNPLKDFVRWKVAEQNINKIRQLLDTFDQKGAAHE